jgi:peptidoglycan DL-endopeptidase CwlO
VKRRHRTRAAIAPVCAALVCALTVLGGGGTAFAAPALPSAPALPGAPLQPAPPGSPAAPGTGSGTEGRTLEEIRLELEDLYHRAVSATDAYNLAEERVSRQTAELTALAGKAVEAQKRIDELKNRAGAAAREQYRGGGFPAEAQLMLTGDPRLFLDSAGRVRESHKATRDLLGELERTQADLISYSETATEQWRRLTAERAKRDRARKEISARIAAAEEIEGRLEEEEKARLLELEREAAARAQARWVSTGALGSVGGEATEEGGKAVEFAMRQAGKPYEWGAEGPGSYDCSGLTSQAWGAAGRLIPRTSQEQWRQLPRVAVKDLRPGDLIVYHQDASHIGMYIGNGSIVHAPRPGRTVTVTGAGSMPILGVVRPGG